MGNITYRIEGGNFSENEVKKIVESFKNRVNDILSDEVSAIIVINPQMQNYGNRKYESISGNTPRYLIDDSRIITTDIRIRLASFLPQDPKITLLYIIERDSCKTLHPKVATDKSFVPKYIEEEVLLLSNIIKYQDSAITKANNVFCISGETGIGKTHFVYYLANKLNRHIHIVSYSDIDGENTSVISENIKKLWSRVNNSDFVLFEDSDSYLTGHNINRFVKNAIVSSFANQKKGYIFLETANPDGYENDIRKHIFKYIYLSPLDDKLRLEYLEHFLINFSASDIDCIKENLSLVGFSVKDLAHLAFIANVNLSYGVPAQECIIRACEEINNSKLHSVLSSDAPFKAIHPKYKLDDLVLPEEKKELIKYAISLIDNIPLVYDKWNFSLIDPYPRAILNFYGDPGTGKTMCAHAIAEHLGKDLLALNYAEIESKYIGDAPKKLESAFAYARQHNVVMFFDEADSFLGKRVEDVKHSADQALNSLRSTMLIQLEMYQGVVIFATNLRENYDKAFKSRFLYEIQFDLPDSQCRRMIINRYLNKLKPLSISKYSDEQLDKIVCDTSGLSGRDIKSIFLDALNLLAYKSSTSEAIDDEGLPIDLLLDCIANRQKAKDNYSVNTDVEEDKRVIGELLKKDIDMEERKKNYEILLSLGYYAAWADGALQQEELKCIQASQEDLGITLPDYTNQNNLPDWLTLISQIKERGLVSQAIDFSIQIISANGENSSEEIQFISKLCDDLSIKQDLKEDILTFLKLNTERTRTWNSIKSNIF